MSNNWKNNSRKNRRGIMADSHSLSSGVQFGIDTAPLDELDEKQRKTQERAEQTANKLE